MRSIFITGTDTGVGKTVVVQKFLENATDGYVNVPIIFSAQTAAKNLRDIFEESLEKKKRNLLGPPAGKKMSWFRSLPRRAGRSRRRRSEVVVVVCVCLCV